MVGQVRSGQVRLGQVRLGQVYVFVKQKIPCNAGYNSQYLINDFNRCNLKRRLITFLACRGQSADVRAVLRSNIKNLFVVSIVNDFFNVVFINVVNVKIVFDVKKLFSTRTTGSGVRGCSSKRTQTVTKEGNYYKIWFVH